MGIMMTKDMNENSDLNRRITADLRQRAQSSSRDLPDGVNDAAYVRDTKKTGKYTWVWGVLIVLAIISLICIAFV